MDNRIIAKASKKRLLKCILFLMAAGIAALIIYTINFRADAFDKCYWITHTKIGTYLGYQPQDFFLYGLTFPIEFGVSFVNTILAFLWMAAPILSVVIFLMASKCEICVSDNMVQGKHSFGKSGNLPMAKITSVGTGIFNSVVIAVGSEKYKFWMLDNNQEISDKIKAQIGSAEVIPPSNEIPVDELKKAKDLLDAGIITQEEFEAKKKQLLGL